MLKSLPLTALVAALALGACNQAPTTTDNAAVDVDNAMAPDDSALNDTPVVEDAASAPAVTVVEVPKPAAGTTAAEAEPLQDAGTIEDEIRAGTGIQRVRYGDGWAWTREGRIVRTADRDGRNVAYFRGGETKPFFVQRGDRSFAYQGGKPVREFDHDGRGRAPDADHVREADKAANDAHDQRQHAEQARDHARDNPRDNNPQDTSHDNPRGDRGDHRPGATPTPTPTPTPDHRRGDRDPNRDRDHR